MSENEAKQGGASWELGRASERMAQAVLSGDADAIQRAMADHAAALGTQATQAMASVASMLLIEVRGITSRLDKRDTIDLDYRADLRQHLDDRFDAFGRELDQIPALREEVSTRLGKIEADTTALKEGQVTFTNRLEELDQRHGNQWEEVRTSVEHLSERLNADEERLDKKRAEIDAIKQELATVREELAFAREYITTSRRAELDELKARVAQLEAQLKRDGDN